MNDTDKTAYGLIDSPEARAQIARVLANHGIRVELDAIRAAGFKVETAWSSPQVPQRAYELHVTLDVVLPIAFSECAAIATPIPLQATSPAHVRDWTDSMAAEYRRQFDERMQLPNPGLLVHPDQVDLWRSQIHG